MLDATGPLVYILEQLTSNEEADADAITLAIQQALRFLGNTSAHMSVERRTEALAKLNLFAFHQNKGFSVVAGSEECCRSFLVSSNDESFIFS